MDVSVSEKDREIVKLLVNDLIKIKQQVQEYLIALSLGIGEGIIKILVSYREYSLSNIKHKGLGEIMFQRALRFFKMQDQYKKKTGINSKNKQKSMKSQTCKNIFKRTIKFILLPVYVFVVLLLQVKKKNFRKNLKKNVINKYEY